MPYTKTVLVHRCKHADVDDEQELKCSCKFHTTERRALEMIASGLAAWKKAPSGTVDKKNLMSCGRQPKAPRAPTIEKAHIERTYPFGGNEYERARIEAYKKIDGFEKRREV
jgi:hypothetical protein